MKAIKFKIIIFCSIGILICSCKYSNEISVNKRKKEKINIDTSKYSYALIEGEKQFILGNYKAAEILMNECLKLNKRASVPYYNLAKIELRYGNLENAKTFIDSAIERNHKNKWYFKFLMQVNLERNDIDGAINSTKELILLEPEEIANYIYLTDLYISKGDYNSVLKVYEEIERKMGYSQNLALEKVKLLDLINDNKRAKEELIKLIEIDPNNAYYYGLLAEFYVEEIEYEKALKAYEKVSELEPKNGIIHLSMFEFYTRIGEKKKALIELENAVKHDDVELENKLQAIIKLSNIYRSEDIENYQEKLINILDNKYKNEYRVGLLKVDILMKKEKYDEARNILIKITDSIKGNFFVWQQLMHVENLRNDNASLQIKSEEALTLFPNQPIFYMFNGVANYNLKSYDNAIAILKSGLDFSSGNKEIKKQIFTYLAESLYRKNVLQESFMYFDKALSIDSNDTYILNNYSYYLALENMNLEKADVMMRRCIGINSKSSSYLDTYAWIFFKRKSFKEALKYIELAYNNGGDKNEVIVEHYGDILFKNGLKNQAIDMWKLALELGSVSKVIKRKIEEGRLVDDVQK